MPKIAYVGPSWANRSFDTPMGDECDFTNIALELKLEVDNLSMLGGTNDFFINYFSKNIKKYDAIIWIYCEPINEISNVKNFLESDDCWNMRNSINQHSLQKINGLGVPVALVGAHSDITDCQDYDSITVIHPSWQKFLADYSGTHLEHGWGCEVAHRMYMEDYPSAKMSKKLVNYVSETWKAWCELDLNGVFCWCHPNRKGNELFAEAISEPLQYWIKNV